MAESHVSNAIGIRSPLVAIVGQTATGKTALAISIAERFDGEIICADSRTVYTGMDIGTAKPTPAERRQVMHHGLDLVAPDRTFSAADFQSYAKAKIADIAARGKLPILVGGTGLYIDAVLFDYTFRQPADPVTRERLNRLTVEELRAHIISQGIDMPANSRNPRHLIRALETGGAAAEHGNLRPGTIMLGLQVEREVLRNRIVHRVEAMLKAGLLEEVRRLSQLYGWNCQALQTPGYRAFRQYFEGHLNMQEAMDAFVRNDMNLAKRQLTWFKRNKSIHWIVTEEKLDEAVDIITTSLNK